MSSSLGNPERSISIDGFYYGESSVLGKQVDALLANGYYLKTVEGPRFCKALNFDDERIRNIIETLLPGSSLGFTKPYGATARDLCVLNRTPEEAKVILAQLWSCKSQMVFCWRSHRHVLDAIAAPIALLKILPAELEKEDIEGQNVSMESGGFQF
ncbi:uncharacterized protein MAM_07220 [Metarhizium album ARSEF 1941]|uniref:Uncharacterized protein n=1 Tax=Metarhizium album (strain ARSEF 1941) TaxID=1081103 RepID=A0A0B2WM19_METAS|nr:uncharacterized protein MAM_07220 [Metarhizium album ARSEF 1941]KHN94993.1 hypothetical protein MAM_07220 [Metarhizium album ARSEF 1941]